LASSRTQPPAGRVRTGNPGLDFVLNGGLPANRLYLVRGDPGVGKTTFALQFLLEGVRAGERVLYITLSETEEELRAVAESHGWLLDGVSLFELTAAEQRLNSDAQNTLFHPSEVELQETTDALLAHVEKVQPTRVVFDSLSEMRLLAQSSLRYRRQILALKQFFAGRSCTVVMLDDQTAAEGDQQVESIVHGVLLMEQLAPEYGAERRRLRVIKLRGVKVRGGYHDYNIETGGLTVFPRLVAAEHHEPFKTESCCSGIPELDQLWGGGIHRGSSLLILGPAGSGKSSIAVQYALAAAIRGERSAFYLFEERPETLLARAASMGMDVKGRVEQGLVELRQVDPGELAPGALVAAVRHSVERDGARFVVIDSLNGYLNAMPEERFLTIQMHELLSYLGQLGVISILVVTQHGMLGQGMVSPLDASYLADSVLLLRYFEHAGQIRQAISVVKKRTGGHERTIRELRMGQSGIEIGEPLQEFQGVLTGVPVYRGASDPLLKSHDELRDQRSHQRRG
jgi:circadian clock protein KaiC